MNILFLNLSQFLNCRLCIIIFCVFFLSLLIEFQLLYRMQNLSRKIHGEQIKRNLLAVPSHRHYFRNMKTAQNKPSIKINNTSTIWKPLSCKYLIGICCSIFIIILMFYLKSIASNYTHYYYWNWTTSDYHHNSRNIINDNLIETSLKNWLKKYPSIKPHRAHKGFTCDLWNCESTYINNKWIEPRKEYKVLLPDNNAYYEWMDRHNKQNNQLIDIKQNCEWIFIGDSITSSWSYHKNIFNKYFNTNNNAIIYAQSGDKIHEIGWRLNDKQGNFI